MRKYKVLDIDLGQVAEEIGCFDREVNVGVIGGNDDIYAPLRFELYDRNECLQGGYKKVEIHYTHSHDYQFVGSGGFFLGSYAIVRSMSDFPPESTTIKFASFEWRRPLGFLPAIKPMLMLSEGGKPILIPEKNWRQPAKVIFANLDAFDWIVLERHSHYSLFKVLGVSLRKGVKDVNYLLGRDYYTGVPFSLMCPPDYAKKGMEDCLRWCMQADKSEVIVQV